MTADKPEGRAFPRALTGCGAARTNSVAVVTTAFKSVVPSLSIACATCSDVLPTARNRPTGPRMAHGPINGQDSSQVDGLALSWTFSVRQPSTTLRLPTECASSLRRKHAPNFMSSSAVSWESIINPGDTQ